MGFGDETPARIEEEVAEREEEEDASHVPQSCCHVSLHPPLLALNPGDSKIKDNLELDRGMSFYGDDGCRNFTGSHVVRLSCDRLGVACHGQTLHGYVAVATYTRTLMQSEPKCWPAHQRTLTAHHHVYMMIMMSGQPVLEHSQHV